MGGVNPCININTRTDKNRRRILQRKWTMNIGFWNVRSLNSPGALDQLNDELQRYKIDIAAIQETKWPSSGGIALQGAQLYYSGSKNNKRENGTGFVVSNRVLKYVKTFTPIDDRMCKIRLKGKFYNTTIFSVYAPTEQADQDTKEQFYAKLHHELETSPGYDVKIICGDLNAKIGRELEFIATIGNQSLHEQCNENGNMLVSFAQATNMVVRSTQFPRKDIHKATWWSNDNVTKNQIDHFLVDSRHASTILGVRTYRGAECDTDHYLVVAKYFQRLSGNKRVPPETTKRWNCAKLEDAQIQTSFENKIAEKLVDVGDDREIGIDGKWERVKSAVYESADTVLGPKPVINNKWMDEECLQVVEDKKRARDRMLNDSTKENIDSYREANRKARQLCRKKKREQLEKQITNMEVNMKSNNSKEAYQVIKMAKRGYQPKLLHCKDENGNVVINEDRNMQMWSDYFRELLNVKRSEAERTFDLGRTVNAETEEPPSFSEVEEAVHKLKNNKASGEDGVIAELVKAGGKVLSTELHTLILEIWEKEEMPEDWKRAIIHPIFKKGDRSKCGNYRGIALLSVGYKVYANILLERLRPYVKEVIGDYQAGFKRNRSTIDKIFSLRQVHEKCWDSGVTLYQVFVDFKKAYDSIYREVVEKILVETGVPCKLAKLIQNTIDQTSYRVRVNGRLSTPFTSNAGLRQGDSLSPTVFNIVLDWVIRRAQINSNAYLFRNNEQTLAYADDIGFISTNRRIIEENITKLVESAKTVGLELNNEKTEAMITGRKAKEQAEAAGGSIKGFKIVDSFKYLGAIFNSQSDIMPEIKARIGSATKVLGALGKILRAKFISHAVKIRIYKTIIRPVLIYGCQTWVLNKNAVSMLQIFERKVMRKIYGPIRVGNDEWRIRTNRELQDLWKEENIIGIVKSTRLRWLGHVERGKDAVTRCNFQSDPVKPKVRGRPKTKWKDCVFRDLQQLGKANWRRFVNDRVVWRRIVKEGKTLKS